MAKRPASRYRISTRSSDLDIGLIHAFLRDSYWAKGMPRRLVAKSIRNSLCFGVFDGKKQVGFARVITDRATFAYLADVFVVPSHRGRGLAAKLIARILRLYSPFGFKPLAHPERFLTIAVADPYRTKRRVRRRSAP
jgi:hypothetical protein